LANGNLKGRTTAKDRQYTPKEEKASVLYMDLDGCSNLISITYYN